MSITTMLRIVAICLALGWYAMPKAKAAEQRIDCPMEIPRATIQITQAPAGWKPFVPFEFRPGVPLTGAGVMYGPPSIMAISKPTSGTRTSAKWSDIRALEDGVWMACFYGDAGNEDMILSRRLNDATKECSVTYGRSADKRVRLDIRCQ